MPTDPLSVTFSALADPTRRAILARLSAGETSVTELAQPFAMSLPAVSKHLKVLERAGLIARGGAAEGSRRVDRAVPPVLGGELRPVGRVPGGAPGTRKGGRRWAIS